MFAEQRLHSQLFFWFSNEFSIWIYMLLIPLRKRDAKTKRQVPCAFHIAHMKSILFQIDIFSSSIFLFCLWTAACSGIKNRAHQFCKKSSMAVSIYSIGRQISYVQCMWAHSVKRHVKYTTIKWIKRSTWKRLSTREFWMYVRTIYLFMLFFSLGHSSSCINIEQAEKCDLCDMQ